MSFKRVNERCQIVLCLILVSLLLLLVVGCHRRDSGYYTTAIREAVEHGQIDTIKSLLEKKPELISARYDGGYSLLSVAIWFGNSSSTIDVIELLISKGADVNAKTNSDRTPLHEVAGLGENEVIKLLLDSGAEVNAKTHIGITPLHCAALNGRHNGTIQLLLDNGADIHAKDSFGITVLETACQIPEFSLSDMEKPSDIDISTIEIIQRDNYDDMIKTVELLLDNGADANTRVTYKTTSASKTEDQNYEKQFITYPILYRVVFNDQTELVKVLLDHGADANSMLPNGGSMLHLCSARGNIEIAKMLIDKGADINAICSGDTALSFAERFNHKQLADLLRSHGAK